VFVYLRIAIIISAFQNRIKFCKNHPSLALAKKKLQMFKRIFGVQQIYNKEIQNTEYRGRVKVNLYFGRLSTCMRAWLYISIHYQPQSYIEVSAQLHDPAVLPPVERVSIARETGG
jgi:hypothetical protein